MYSNFIEIFNYDFTKKMELLLDEIEKGNKTYDDVVGEFNKKLNSLIKNKTFNKNEIKIDENHTYIIGKYGPVIKCVINGKTTFKKIKKDIDLDMLKDGRYEINDIVDLSNNSLSNSLGKYNDVDIYIKKGKFGYYLNHKPNNYSLASLKLNDTTIKEITLNKAIEIIKNGGIKITAAKSIVKKINENASIRKGKYGNYVYYKTETMKKPIFLPLKKTKIEDVDDEWIANAITVKFNNT